MPRKLRGIFISISFTVMIRFPNCKINLGLSVTHKREDGYHEIDTVFYPLALHDALEFIEHDTMHFDLSGLDIPGASEDNIVLKAYHLLKNDYPSLPSIHIHLHKTIPTGGGLGGGSSNAAFMLQMLNDEFSLGLSNIQLGVYALQLGSDCPFFISNQPCHAGGRGELLTPISLDLSAYRFILVFPGIHIHTAKAFDGIKPGMPLRSTELIIQQSVSSWKEELQNDFEEVIFHQHPELEQIKQAFYKAGAVYSSMSGSGSTMFCMVEKNQLEEVLSNMAEERLFNGLGLYIAGGL